jgi:hypothetical protein
LSRSPHKPKIAGVLAISDVHRDFKAKTLV